jgi:D-glycero-D-manno-heptose 1,7-bisphosphate phosphatase
MPLIIFDRDGVINEESAAYIKSPAEWRPIPGSLEAIARFNRAGWQVAVATNQAGVGRGLFDLDILTAIHRKMHAALAAVGGRIDLLVFCPHTPDDNCTCRKPEPGLLREIAERLSVSLTDVPAVGDSERDLAAARAVGARPILVHTGNGAATAAALAPPDEVEMFADLAAVAGVLLKS